MANFKDWENCSPDTKLDLVTVLDQLAFNDQGLIPAIAQDIDSRQVLMMAWMNRQALENTLNEGVVTYFSRSRQALWRKGDTSGHRQQLVSLHCDCDGDALLLLVKQTGAACHTFRPHCFYFDITKDGVTIKGEPVE